MHSVKLLISFCFRQTKQHALTCLLSQNSVFIKTHLDFLQPFQTHTHTHTDCKVNGFGVCLPILICWPVKADGGLAGARHLSVECEGPDLRPPTRTGLPLCCSVCVCMVEGAWVAVTTCSRPKFSFYQDPKKMALHFLRFSFSSENC